MYGIQGLRAADTTTTGPRMTAQAPDVRELIVHTETGDVRGIVVDGVCTWRGIPYAAPPVNDLRFRAPQPATAWREVRDAGSFGPIPMQKRGFEAMCGAGARTPISEDCLTINVSAPMRHNSQLRPVVFWIYGGGFTLGGSRGELYRGNRIVLAGDVVFVSFNYRLGIFGFVDLSSWSTTDCQIDSNLGLRDQVAALQWVQRNIATFGGDPDNVTIVGESAGAMSVVSLMCIPSAAGLFHRAFAMSACGFTAYSQERHRLWAEALVKSLKLNPGDNTAVAHELKSLPAENLVTAASNFFYDTAPDAHPGVLPSSPVVDGDFLPRHPIDAFEDGTAHRLPLVIGTMSREGALLHRALPVICSRVSRLDAMFEQTAPALRGRIIQAYPGYPSKKTAIDVAGDFTFWLPTVRIASAHSRLADCWVYRFDYAAPLTRLMFGEATHGLDLPMLFGTTGEGEMGRFDLFRRRSSKQISQRFQGTFLDFVHGRSPRWSRYDEQGRLTRIFDTIDREEGDPRRERRLAWADFKGPP